MKASIKYLKISPLKVYKLVKILKNKTVNQAINILTFINKKGALLIKNSIKSAIFNAINNFKILNNNLKISTIIVNKGPFIKRLRPTARGIAHPYKKRTSHIFITLKQIKNYGTKNTS